MNNYMKPLISKATESNWKKLGKSVDDDKLSSRANKKLSKKRIFPKEYFRNIDNASDVQAIVDYIDNNCVSIEDALYTLCVSKIRDTELFVDGKYSEVAEKFLSEYQYDIDEHLVEIMLPDDEDDILGLIYQCLREEGEKNILGAYYTPSKIVQYMLKDCDLTSGSTLLDPACGSGNFLICSNAISPDQLYGIDIDPIAVMLAKANIITKFPKHNIYPHIYCLDFSDNCNETQLSNLTFDYIVTNPPWGASIGNAVGINEITSGESFSLFFVKSVSKLSSEGTIEFLLPEAVLNVKTHQDIRDYLLSACNLEKITLYPDMFSGVTTKYISISVNLKNNKNTVEVGYPDDYSCIEKSEFLRTKNHVFSFVNNEDCKIIDKVYAKGAFDLSNSIWALGIVTGDNKNTLKKEPFDGSEEIFTGKEIKKYTLLSAKNHILYDRGSFQQIAKEEYYRAPEKLVYKFISNKLVFAYDDKQRLFLNSANILIPNIPGMSTLAVMALLNSNLYQFLYKKIFGEIKILKGNLCELPFPKLTGEENEHLTTAIEGVIENNGSDDEIQKYVYSLFSIDMAEATYIEKYVIK